jgi:hypothetical protein
MAKRRDGVLRLPAQSFELGGVLVNRADAFLAAHPKSQDELRRIFTLKLATVRKSEERGGFEATRRRPLCSEFSDEEWRLVSELADHPNRLLVTVAPQDGEAYAEVAHEAIFRRWNELHKWIATEGEFLAWRTGLEAARYAWQVAPDGSKTDALLMGLALVQAQSWLAKRQEDLNGVDRKFIDLSVKHGSKARARGRHRQALIYVLLVGIIAALVGAMNESYLIQQWKYLIARPYYQAKHVRVLSPDRERELSTFSSGKLPSHRSTNADQPAAVSALKRRRLLSPPIDTSISRRRRCARTGLHGVLEITLLPVFDIHCQDLIGEIRSCPSRSCSQAT